MGAVLNGGDPVFIESTVDGAEVECMGTPCTLQVSAHAGRDTRVRCVTRTERCYRAALCSDEWCICASMPHPCPAGVLTAVRAL